MHWLGWLVVAVGASQVAMFPYEEFQRNAVAREARAYALSRSKPVLDFGCGRHPRGDVNVDIVPRTAPNFVRVESFQNAMLPFENKHFGAALCFHVLEHVENPRHLLNELNRVADKVFVITPSPLFIGSWLHEGHRRVFLSANTYVDNPLYPHLQGMSKVIQEFPLLYPMKKDKSKEALLIE